MAFLLSASDDTISSILSCQSEEYQDRFADESILTERLSYDALHKIIPASGDRLRGADKKYRLDDLLSAMLTEAPHPSGQRYVAICLHIAHSRGEDAVVNVAKAWLDNLIIPMLAVSKADRTIPTRSQTPDLDDAVQVVQSASWNSQGALRNDVAHREDYHCAIIKSFDFSRAEKLINEDRADEIPVGPRQRMEAAHIIPFSLNKFNDKNIMNSEIKEASATWDMLQSWTQMDFKTFNTPANAIYMTKDEHASFGNFMFYFDKEAYPDIPNKYKVRMARRNRCLSNGLQEVDVMFPTLDESSIKPPNSDYLKVHAAFAKVLNLCGAADYVESVERDAEMEGSLRLDGETDFGSYLRLKLAVSIFV